MKEDLIVTLVQTNLFWEDPHKNRLHFEKAIGSIELATDLIILPETFNTGFSINPDLCAEHMDGTSMIFLKRMAQEKSAHIMTTMIIRENGHVFNRLVLIHPDGRVDSYDKRHLFRLSEEYRIFDAGMTQRNMVLKGWNIRPIVCYDLRFPVWCKNTFQNGLYNYDLLICVANWPASRAHIWKTLLVARGIENQVYSIGLNRIGTDGHGTRHSGDSMVSDAKGNILYSAPTGEETVHTISLNASDLEFFRQSFTVGMDWDSFSISM